MASTKVIEHVDKDKSDDTLIIIVNADGTLTVDPHTLEKVLANQSRATVSVIRIDSPDEPDSQTEKSGEKNIDQEDDGPRVNLTVEGFYPPPPIDDESKEIFDAIANADAVVSSTVSTPPSQPSVQSTDLVNTVSSSVPSAITLLQTQLANGLSLNSNSTCPDGGVGDSLGDAFSEMDTEQIIRLETALHSEKAKQILGDEVTSMLDILKGGKDGTNLIQNNVHFDHCYTTLLADGTEENSVENDQNYDGSCEMGNSRQQTANQIRNSQFNSKLGSESIPYESSDSVTDNETAALQREMVQTSFVSDTSKDLSTSSGKRRYKTKKLQNSEEVKKAGKISRPPTSKDEQSGELNLTEHDLERMLEMDDDHEEFYSPALKNENRKVVTTKRGRQSTMFTTTSIRGRRTMSKARNLVQSKIPFMTDSQEKSNSAKDEYDNDADVDSSMEQSDQESNQKSNQTSVKTRVIKGIRKQVTVSKEANDPALFSAPDIIKKVNPDDGSVIIENSEEQIASSKCGTEDNENMFSSTMDTGTQDTSISSDGCELRSSILYQEDHSTSGQVYADDDEDNKNDHLYKEVLDSLVKSATNITYDPSFQIDNHINESTVDEHVSSPVIVKVCRTGRARKTLNSNAEGVTDKEDPRLLKPPERSRSIQNRPVRSSLRSQSIQRPVPSRSQSIQRPIQSTPQSVQRPNQSRSRSIQRPIQSKTRSRSIAHLKSESKKLNETRKNGSPNGSDKPVASTSFQQENLKNTQPNKRSVAESSTTEDDESEREDSGLVNENEDDPNKLWCICNKPHNNRFMICCDSCDNWFHGYCVGITKAMGEKMEKNGSEWICPPCKKEKSLKERDGEQKLITRSSLSRNRSSSESITGSANISGQINTSVTETQSSDLSVSENIPQTPSMTPSQTDDSVNMLPVTDTSTSNKPAAIVSSTPISTTVSVPETVTTSSPIPNVVSTPITMETVKPVVTKAIPRALAPRGQVMCINCKEEVTSPNDGIYCSDACVDNYVLESLNIINSDKKEPLNSNEKLIVCERSSRRLIAGPNAPSANNIRSFLKQHRMFEIVRPSSLPNSKFYATSKTAPVKNVSTKPVTIVRNRDLHPNVKNDSKPSNVQHLMQKTLQFKNQDSNQNKQTNVLVTNSQMRKLSDSAESKIVKHVDKPQSTIKQYMVRKTLNQPASTDDTIDDNDKFGKQLSGKVLDSKSSSQNIEVKEVEDISKKKPMRQMKIVSLQSHPTSANQSLNKVAKTSPQVAETNLKNQTQQQSVILRKRKFSEDEKPTKQPLMKKSEPLLMKKVEQAAVKKPEQAPARKPEQVLAKKPDQPIAKKMDIKKPEPVIIKKSVEDSPREDFSATGLGSEVDPVRHNVKKSLLELLTSRLKETPEIKLTNDEVLKLSNDIEEELHNLFKDTGMKYKSKYRSLLFNIKDKKNTLFVKIAERSLNPYNLVRLTPEELASQELAQWRQREAKHEIDMIKKSELELLTQTKTHVVKTHKGEQEIETDDKVQSTTDITVPELTSDLGEDIEDRRESGKKLSHYLKDKSYISNDNIGVNIQSKEDKKGHGEHGKHHRKKHDHKDRHRKHRKRSSDRDRYKRHHSRSSRSSHRHREKSEDRKDDKTKSENDKNEPSDNESHTPPHPPMGDLLLDEELVDPIAGTIDKPLDLDLELTDNEPSSTVMISTPPYISSPPERGVSILWKGFIAMPDVAKFPAGIKEISGNCAGLRECLDDVIECVGRINPTTVWDYIAKVKRSGNKEILLFRFIIVDLDFKIDYLGFYSYLNNKNRMAVVGNMSPGIKDFYLFPLPSHCPVPQVLLPIDGPGFGESRPPLLLGIVVRSKRSKLLYGSSASRQKTIDQEPYLIPSSQDLYVPAPPGMEESFTPPHSPTRKITQPALGSELDENADDEPYSPGEEMPYSPSSVPIDDKPIIKSDEIDLKKKMEELNRKIEEEKQLIKSMSSSMNQIMLPQVYSPSNANEDSESEEIRLPTNIQQILDSIKKRGPDQIDSSTSTSTYKKETDEPYSPGEEPIIGDVDERSEEFAPPAFKKLKKDLNEIVNTVEMDENSELSDAKLNRDPRQRQDIDIRSSEPPPPGVDDDYANAIPPNEPTIYPDIPPEAMYPVIPTDINCYNSYASVQSTPYSNVMPQMYMAASMYPQPMPSYPAMTMLPTYSQSVPLIPASMQSISSTIIQPPLPPPQVTPPVISSILLPSEMPVTNTTTPAVSVSSLNTISSAVMNEIDTNLSSVPLPPSPDKSAPPTTSSITLNKQSSNVVEQKRSLSDVSSDESNDSAGNRNRRQRRREKADERAKRHEKHYTSNRSRVGRDKDNYHYNTGNNYNRNKFRGNNHKNFYGQRSNYWRSGGYNKNANSNKNNYNNGNNRYQGRGSNWHDKRSVHDEWDKEIRNFEQQQKERSEQIKKLESNKHNR